MEAEGFFKIFVSPEKSTRRHRPQDHNLKVTLELKNTSQEAVVPCCKVHE